MSQPNVLVVYASMRKSDSVSRELTSKLITKLDPAGLIERDLLTEPVPQINEDWIHANFTPADKRSDAQKQALALSDTLINEIQQADLIVFATPIYNFSIPAALKAWVDQVCRAGVTFKYTETGPEGLLTDKTALIVETSGGTTVGSDIDFATPYLQHVCGFLGVTAGDVFAADTLMANPDRTKDAEQKIEQFSV
ncbi:MAG: NAD(P)H-dependent oxidoreductase [Pseudomonadota bacterium]|nr:NAD(P)H-dependent oxidoreductase [Pseudomonadota bacterium]